MSLEINFTRPETREAGYKCKICGPLVCRAESEGFLGHIPFFLYLSFTLLGIAIVLEFLLPSLNILMPLINLPLSSLLFILSTFLGGLRIFVEGFEELLEHREFDVDFLVFLAAVGGIAIGLYLEAALVVNLFVVADYLETIAVAKAEREIKTLMKYFPQKARVLKNGKEIEVPIERVLPGEKILVRPGERIPLDGIIIEGEANIDQSVLTGESIPVYKTVNNEVFAGTFCLDGKLVIKVQKPARESLFNKIIQMVLEAREKKAKIESFVESFANKYVPIVLTLSMAIMVLGPILFGGTTTSWIYRGLVLLVLSCPCALTISVPAGLVAGIVNAAKRGILIKGGKHLEISADTKVVALDKTGTLTRGELRVKEIITLSSDASVKEILVLASSVANLSNHPVSRAIVEKARSEGIELLNVEKFKEHPGRGIRGFINGKQVLVGSLKLLRENNVEISTGILGEIMRKGIYGKMVYVAVDHSPVGILVLEDVIKSEARDAINLLKKRVAKVVMMTGDDEVIARRVAESVGIEEYYANMFPHEKAEKLKELAKEVGPVMFAGDGINDAPAIAVADVGVAMGMKGIDTTIETADIVLANDNLLQIPYLIDLAKQTKKIISFNVALSILFKLLLVILALLGMITLIEAVLIGDDGLAIVVAINSMRILRYRGKNRS
ncbi:MAG: heavy metal translocating P-type ATPase [Candidatus Njordarchaeales archaeon]